MKIFQLITNHLELSIFAILVFFGYWRITKHQRSQRFAKRLLKEAIDTKSDEPLTLHPDIDASKCTGCASCTSVCPEGDILQLVNHKAVLVGPTKCIGHGECEAACPMGAISLVFGTKTKGVDIPRLTTNYETNVPGLYIAGELGGMGLIRNAIRQGVAAANHASQKLIGKKTAKYDLFIVGAGPAGMAASLAATANGNSYLTIEQNSFGGTVFNFPRQKIVMTHPAELPLVGEMKFPKNHVTKEELLGFWTKIRRSGHLQIKENTKFEGLEKKDGHFVVSTSAGQFTAEKVILALGLRGTPRKLGIKNEDLAKVTYNLLDPEQYEEKNICVVGGGNAGVEAALMLAERSLKNRVTLLVRGEKLDRCNEENKHKVQILAKQGVLEIWFQSSVKQIETNSLVVAKNGTDVEISNDFLFIFAGADLPHKFLMGLGIKLDKKFGEGLRKSS